MSDKAIAGTPISGAERRSRVFGRNRTCREPGCETRLSMYNNGKYCYLHEPLSVPRTRGKKIA
jgi:hypothetical protein